MRPVAAGVLRRRPGEPRAPRYRRRREPTGPFHEEAADAEMELADQRKYLAIRLNPR